MSKLPSIAELILLLAREERKATEIIEEIKGNIDESESVVNSYINLFLDEALEQAREVDASGDKPDEEKPLA